MKFVLVTGAAGFIGRNACRALANHGFCVLGLGHGNWDRNEWEVWGIAEWISADITHESLDALVGKRPIAAVLHCAGSGTVSFAFHNPLEDFERAVSSTSAVLDWIRIRPRATGRFILLSSAAVYGNQDCQFLSEASAVNPCSPYGFHKLAAELLARSYSHTYDIPVTILRLFSVYGEGLRKQLLWDAINKFSNGQNCFFGTGDEIRDWIHISDLAEILVLACNPSQPLYAIYNCGSSAASVRDILLMLRNALGADIPIAFSGILDKGSPFSLASDSRLLGSSLGWSPKVPLEEGLARFCDWFKTQSSS